MRTMNFGWVFVAGFMLSGCSAFTGALPETQLEAVAKIAVEHQWITYPGNPVITCDEGAWDAGALGTPCVLIVDGVIHLYYEAWGKRGEEGYNPADYDSLQIGHATSVDGIHFVKDPNNPVIPLGKEGAFDHTGSWDPFVIYEDGMFKMWYGGGRKPNELGYATSKDGSHFTKQKQLSFDLKAVNDMHVVHDLKAQRYYQYYWHRAAKPSVLVRVGSGNETDFEFDQPEEIIIDGEEYPGRYIFTQVFIEDGTWYMFYGNFVPYTHCANATIRMATSSDGLNWKLVNNNILPGVDGEVLKLKDELYALYYAPQGYYDRAGADIRLAVYKGSLNDMPRHTEPVVITEEIKEAMIQRTAANKYYLRVAAKVELTEAQLECLKLISKERARKEVEAEQVQKLRGAELKKELGKAGREYTAALSECIGQENMSRL